MTTGRVAGKVALITGAARGLGKACALRLAAEGADLVLLDVGVVSRLETVWDDLGTPAELDATARAARDQGVTVMSRFADVRDGAAMRAAVSTARDRFGSVDIVVASAGIASIGAAWELTDAHWRLMIDVNLTGVWQTAKAAVPCMIEQQGGSIVFVGSAVTYRPESGKSHDAAAKHGVRGLMQTLAREVAPHNIRVNSVDVGRVATEITLSQEALDAAVGHRGASLAEAAEHSMRARPGQLPLPWIDPEDVAEAVLFLASPQARSITGTSLLVDLGATVTG